MSALKYCILLLFVLHQGQSAADGQTTYGVKPTQDVCSSAIIDQLSETMDLVCEVNSRLNNTEVYLDQLKKELSKTGASTDLRIQNVLSTIREHLSNAGNGIQQNVSCVVLGPRDCSDVRSMGFTTSGVYRVYAGGDNKRMQADVYCDFDSFKKSWLVFQRRTDGSENFERNYTQYEQGFGNLTGEFWLGNQILHLLTTNRKYKLRIDLEDFAGEKRFAEYATFITNSSADFYRLTVGRYSGNAGDSLAYHNKMRFSTKDMDNDLFPGDNCARIHHGPWWHNLCHRSNLNGLYLRGPHTFIERGIDTSFGDGIEWSSWRGFLYSLKKNGNEIGALGGLNDLADRLMSVNRPDPDSLKS